MVGVQTPVRQTSRSFIFHMPRSRFGCWFIFAAKVFESVQQIFSLPRGQRLAIGISAALINVALPIAVSAISIKYFSPGKWDKFVKIRNSLFDKSDHDKS